MSRLKSIRISSSVVNSTLGTHEKSISTLIFNTSETDRVSAHTHDFYDPDSTCTAKHSFRCSTAARNPVGAALCVSHCVHVKKPHFCCIFHS